MCFGVVARSLTTLLSINKTFQTENLKTCEVLNFVNREINDGN